MYGAHMARKQRIYYPGAFYHIILRGNAQQDVFFDDCDRYRFLLLMQEAVEKFGCRIHAFCLMSNHIHIALQVGDISLSRVMQNLSFRYTTWINRRMKRSGHLFQGRYKALLVDADTYLCELAAYIHLNPVRAGMVVKPEDYLWSGHHAYLLDGYYPWFTSDYLLGLFDSESDKARELYLCYIAERIGDRLTDQFLKGGIDSRLLGEESFVEEAMGKAQIRMEIKPTLEEIIEIVKGICAVDNEALYSLHRGRVAAEARALIAWGVAEYSDCTISETGRLFGRDVTTLSNSIMRLKLKACSDAAVAGKIDAVRQAIMNKATTQA
jgi:putative transposase